MLPDFDPANFVADAPIDNPFYPLVLGAVRTYEADVKESPDGETVHAVNKVAVTSQTRTIGGVTARVVRDRTVEDGLLVEDAFDYFAQDKQGDVWNLGEDSTAFEYDGQLQALGHQHRRLLAYGRAAPSRASSCRPTRSWA